MRYILFWCTLVLTISFKTVYAQENEKCMESTNARTALNCKLTSPEFQQRKTAVIAALKNLILEKVETENGFRYKFDGSDEVLDKLIEFIKTERKCCDFFVFALTASGDTHVAWLEISGSADAKQFIESELEF